MTNLSVLETHVDGRKQASCPVLFALAYLVLVFIAVSLSYSPVLAAKSDVYTLSRYPIEAQAKDAVTAKKIALDEGQLRAFRSLLKRIVPVSYYGRLPKLKLNHVQDMIIGFSVRNEQNSRTEYLATLEFKFRKKSIQQFLKSYGVPYVDKQAPKLIVIPHFIGAWPGGSGEGNSASTKISNRQLVSRQKHWRTAWRDLDLAHAVVPVQLKALHEKIHADTIRDLISGKEDAFRIVQEEYDTPRVILALAGSEENGRLAVRFIGADAVGRINLARKYSIYDGDFLYTAELASYIGLKVLEGRWKSVNVRQVPVAAANSWGAQQALRAEVEFSGLYEWQQIRQKLTENPDIDELKIGRLSARGADITLDHSGDVGRLRSSLRSSGLVLEENGGRYRLRNQ